MLSIIRTFLAGRLSERARGIIYRALLAAGLIAVAFELITQAQLDTILPLLAQVLGAGLATANTSIKKET